MALSPKQMIVIEALLEGASQKEAAQRAGVTPRSVRRWLREDGEFKEHWTEARTEALRAVTAHLQRAGLKATGRLERLLEDEAVPPYVAVGCIRTALEMFFKGLETWDIAERLEALERRLGGEQ